MAIYMSLKITDKLKALKKIEHRQSSVEEISGGG